MPTPSASSPRPRRALRGLHITELALVAGIIAILSCLLIPGLRAAKELAMRTRCQSSLRQCAAGGLAYALDNRGIIAAAWQDLFDHLEVDATVARGASRSDKRGGSVAMDCPAWQGNTQTRYFGFGTGSSNNGYVMRSLARLDALPHRDRTTWFVDNDYWGTPGGPEPLASKRAAGTARIRLVGPRHPLGLNVATYSGRSAFIPTDEMRTAWRDGTCSRQGPIWPSAASLFGRSLSDPANADF